MARRPMPRIDRFGDSGEEAAKAYKITQAENADEIRRQLEQESKILPKEKRDDIDIDLPPLEGG